MPLFDYECLNCGYLLEILDSRKDRDLDLYISCPICPKEQHGAGLYKKVSFPSLFILKGDGFYKRSAK